jgi:LPS export ABC transporter protein LptC
MRKAVFFIAGFVLVAWAAMYVYRAMKDSSEVEARRVAGSAEDLKQKVLTFSIDGRTGKGVKQWHLEGNAAEIINEEVHMENLNAVVYGEGFTATLLSDKGNYKKDKGEVELIGNVKVTSEDGGLLMTDHAIWSQNTKEIRTESVVRIERQGMIAIGKGALANSEESWAKLLKDVSVQMEPATMIKCAGALEVRGKENKAVFNEKVHVTDKDGELFADKMTVLIDPKSRKISQVIAEGNVKLVRGKSYTLCEKATYTDGTKSVQFLGRPKIIIAPEEIQASGAMGGGGFLSEAMGGDPKDKEKSPPADGGNVPGK